MVDKDLRHKELESKKKADSIKHLYFSRYMLIRYSITFFLFINLFWFLVLIQYKRSWGIAVSGLMTLYSGIAAIEQLSKMYNFQKDLPLGKIYLNVQILLNVFLSIALFLPLKEELFPFATSLKVKTALVLLLLLIAILCGVCQRRLKKINAGTDKYAKLIKNFERS